MPELPEVQTIVTALNNKVVNKTITKIEVLRPRTIVGDAETFKFFLTNTTINKISRIGKYIVFHLNDEKILISHLRMEGKYCLRDENIPYSVHDMIIFKFSDSTYLAFNDTRRFGRMAISTEDKYLIEPPLSLVAKDPLQITSSKEIIKTLKKKNTAIKTALLDQSIISGIGNIYADEILFMSKIHPETKSKSLTKEQIELILTNSKIVLSKAVEVGGTTIKSFHDMNGQEGKFAIQLQAYGKEGSKCPNCGTIFRKKRVNGRGSTYCPSCQKNPDLPFVIGITGPIASGKSHASRIIAKRKTHIFDADKMVHELYKDPSIQRSIQSIFSQCVILNNEIDRELVRNIISKDDKKKNELEKFVHSHIEIKLREFIKQFDRNELLVLDIPLLFESHFDDYCNKTIIITTNKELQVKRLKKRGVDFKQALLINQSFNLEENISKADYVVENDGSVLELRSKLKKIVFNIR